jgi:hypothetical protein
VLHRRGAEGHEEEVVVGPRIVCPNAMAIVAAKRTGYRSLKDLRAHPGILKQINIKPH